MSIGDVFSKAFELWKRDVLWLVLAAFVVGIIMVAIFIVATLIVVAVGGAAFGLSGGGDSFTGVSAGVLVVGVIVYIIALFVVAAVAMTFYGGVFEMVIGAAKENRPVRFGDLFSGFRKFNSYLVYALVMAGIGIGMVVLAVTIIGIPVAIILGIWISVIWLYVLPLIADRGLTFGDAQAQSRQMVKDVGWWKTFGMVVLLEVAICGRPDHLPAHHLTPGQRPGERRLCRPQHRLRGGPGVRGPVRRLLHRGHVPWLRRRGDARNRRRRTATCPARGSVCGPSSPTRSASRAGHIQYACDDARGAPRACDA